MKLGLKNQEVQKDGVKLQCLTEGRETTLGGLNNRGFKKSGF